MAVADIFDRDGDGYIDYYEFVAALHPNKDAYRPTTDADKIEDEVKINTWNSAHRLHVVASSIPSHAGPAQISWEPTGPACWHPHHVVSLSAFNNGRSRTPAESEISIWDQSECVLRVPSAGYYGNYSSLEY